MKGKQEWIIGQAMPKATCEKAQEMSTGFTSKRVSSNCCECSV